MLRQHSHMAGFGLSGIQHDKTFPQLLSSLLFNFSSPLKFDEDQLRATVCCCAISKVKLFNISSNVQKKANKTEEKNRHTLKIDV